MTAYPWLVPVYFKYSHQLYLFVKEIPGTQWQPADKSWLIPIEMLPKVEEEARKWKVNLQKQAKEELPELF